MFNRIKKYRTERARRKLEEPDRISGGRKKWKLAATVAAVFAMSFAVYAICFAYKAPIVPQVFSNKVAQVHLVSPFEFSYTSDLQTQAKRNPDRGEDTPSLQNRPQIRGAIAGRGEDSRVDA